MKLVIIKDTIEALTGYIELIAVLLITITSTIILINIVSNYFRKDETAFVIWKNRSWRGIQGGLDLLVATDLISTLTINRDLDSVITLGVLLIIRIMISWSLQIEAQGYWPWKKKEYELKEKSITN